MSRKHQFIGSLVNVIKHNRDGSFRTQNDRRESLMYIVKSIYTDGYQLEHVKFIKRRHIEHLVKKWLADEISVGTIKNRMSHLRWMTEKLGTANIIPSNDELNIPKRVYIDHKDKSINLNEAQLEKISGDCSDYIKMSLRAQKLFGLRQEESLKICPFIADQGDKLFLMKSWCKGGRERYIPILTDEQRQWLDDCKRLVKYKYNSLIPSDTSYATYRERFKKACVRAGFVKRHGHRHQYAQKRYEELTGFLCPVKGGPSKQQMTKDQRVKDKEARLAITKEMGHNRPNIVSVYIN